MKKLLIRTGLITIAVSLLLLAVAPMFTGEIMEQQTVKVLAVDNPVDRVWYGFQSIIKKLLPRTASATSLVDYTTDGTDDEVQINAALTAAGAYGEVKVVGTISWSSNPITITNNGTVFDATGAYLQYSGTGNGIEVGGTGYWMVQPTILLGRYDAVGSAITSATAVGVYFDAIQDTTADFPYIYNFTYGTAVQVNADSGYWSEGLYIERLVAISVRKGLEFTGDGAIQSIHIGEFHGAPTNNAARNYGIVDSKTTANVFDVTVNNIWYLSNTITNVTGIEAKAGSWKINQFVWDDNTNGNVSINSTQDIWLGIVEHGHHFFRDTNIPWESFERALKNTFGGRDFNIWLSSDMTEIITGSGNTAYQRGGGYLQIGTGATANSTAGRWVEMAGLSPGGTNWEYIDWDKRLTMRFVVARFGSDSEAVLRIQLKEINTIGQLAETGIGLEIQNLAMYGESYGSSRASIDLSTAMTASLQYDVAIYHDPNASGGPVDMWFVRGSLVNSQTTAGNIPSGSGSAISRLVISAANGASGGTDAAIFVPSASVQIWQED